MASRRVELCSVASIVFLAFLSTYCHLNQRYITGVCLPSDLRLSAMYCQHYKPLSSFNGISRRSNGAIANPAIRPLGRFNKPNWFCFGLLLLCGDIISQPGPTTENTTKKTSFKRPINQGTKSYQHEPNRHWKWKVLEFTLFSGPCLFWVRRYSVCKRNMANWQYIGHRIAGSRLYNHSQRPHC